MHQPSPTQIYLRKENQDLRYQVQQLKQMVQYNKEALRKSIKIDTASETKQLLKLLYAENDNLRSRLNKNYDQISLINSTMLIGQQIVIATQSHEKRIIEQLQSKIYFLKQEIKDKEKKITELEKSRFIVDKGGNMLVKTVFVTTPSLIQMKNHDQLEKLNQQIIKKQNELERQKVKNQDLFKMNLLLNKQLVDLKAMSATSVTSGKKLSNYQQILQCHQQLRKSDQESSYHSSIQSDSDFQKIEDKVPRKAPVPKLELAKAKQIQQLIVKKINNKDRKKSKGEIVQNVNEQKNQLQKQLQQQKLKNFAHQRKISKLIRFITELEQRNKLLINVRNNNQVNNLHLVDCPSNQYMQQLQIRHMLEISKNIYLNDKLQKVINQQLYPQYMEGALSA